MKNKLKGITLLETLLYMGLFSIIIIIVLNFMLSTQESTLRNQRRAVVYQSVQFLTQHIDNNVSKANDINILDTNIVLDTSNVYRLEDERVYFNDVLITQNNIEVLEFNADTVLIDGEVVGINVNIRLRHKADAGIEEDFSFLSIK